MTKSMKTETQIPLIDVQDVIYNRCSVRDYLPKKIDKETIIALLDAAVHAPTAMHEEPCGFVVIQDKEVLNRLSDTAKSLVRTMTQNSDSEQSRHILAVINQEGFHVFYNAETLIIIYSQFHAPFVMADCWLAAENLMLSARSKGLGTCVIGFAIEALNTPEWKKELGIPDKMTAIAPIIVGVPAGETPHVPRKKPEILTWK